MAIVIARTIIVYFALFVTMRLMGKRQFGEMELSEFVVAALIADLASHPLQDIGIPMINGLVPILVLFCCEVLITGVAVKSSRLRAIFYGRPSTLIEKGKIIQREMHKNRFTPDELMQELRSQSCLDISKVEYAILETDGRLSVIPYPSQRPPTATLMSLKTQDESLPIIVICEGRILAENLKRGGYSMSWLAGRLRDLKIGSPERVYLFTVDNSGKVYYALMEGGRT